MNLETQLGREKLSIAFNPVFQIPPELLLSKIRSAFVFSKSFPQRRATPFYKAAADIQQLRFSLKKYTRHLWLQNRQPSCITFSIQEIQRLRTSKDTWIAQGRFTCGRQHTRTSAYSTWHHQHLLTACVTKHTTHTQWVPWQYSESYLLENCLV